MDRLSSFLFSGHVSLSASGLARWFSRFLSSFDAALRLSFRRLSSHRAPLIYGYLRLAPDKCVGMSHFTLGNSNPFCTLEEKAIHRLALGHPLLPS